MRREHHIELIMWTDIRSALLPKERKYEARKVKHAFEGGFIHV